MLGAERDVVLALGRQDVVPFAGRAALALRHVHGRLVQATASVELYQEFLTNALQSYLSQLDVNLNLVMKALTAITVLLAVPTLITAIYGMNFVAFPEIHWAAGYAYVVGLTGGVIAALLFIFRQKEWL